MGDKMKNKRLNVRLTDQRYYKLVMLSTQIDRTISSLVDELIDSLPEPTKSSATES